MFSPPVPFTPFLPSPPLFKMYYNVVIYFLKFFTFKKYIFCFEYLGPLTGNGRIFYLTATLLKKNEGIKIDP